MKRPQWRGTLNDRYPRMRDERRNSLSEIHCNLAEHERWWKEVRRAERLKKRARRIKEEGRRAAQFRENLSAVPLYTRLLNQYTPPFTLTSTIDSE